MLSGIIEGNWLRDRLVIILLQWIDVISIFCVPEFDFFIIRTSNYDVFLLNELDKFNDFMVDLDLPIDF